MYRTRIDFDNSDISRLLSCFHADEMQNLPGVNLVVPVSTRLCLTDEIESGDECNSKMTNIICWSYDGEYSKFLILLYFYGLFTSRNLIIVKDVLKKVHNMSA